MITLMKMKMIGTVVSVITQLVTRPNGISVPFLREGVCPGPDGVIDTGREGAENLRWIYLFLRFSFLLLLFVRGEWVTAKML